jgi:hypothetical protein
MKISQLEDWAYDSVIAYTPRAVKFKVIKLAGTRAEIRESELGK